MLLQVKGDIQVEKKYKKKNNLVIRIDLYISCVTIGKSKMHVKHLVLCCGRKMTVLSATVIVYMEKRSRPR